MILSFGWTHHLLPPHGRKCETRRKADLPVEGQLSIFNLLEG
jgi:hypothetical protein